ncbi:SDR family oxidoreductase [bacterium]|nr:SDR family oxidoreductase [candidate division CSSED10-310 bacterium]
MSEGNGTALVTGAGSRLGGEFALALAGAGYDLAVHYRSSAQGAHGVAAAARDLGRSSEIFQADLNVLEETESLLGSVNRTLGPVTLLVNNASIFRPSRVQETGAVEMEHYLRLHVTAPFILARDMARHLAGRPGAVINLLDWRAFRTDPAHLAYTVSKAALESLTRNLAAALAPTVRVNGLALGAILPPEGMTRDDLPLRLVPQQRWGSVREAIDALLFLACGPEYINGHILVIDGGRNVR